eukprot:TRINITY_DN2595_c0_g2_i1.p1 TRINITY_DN2595_c0_g2~~TRINITY_DN2595_c0_g2_i1.p1  ORF type:complete len:557 (+),score=39.51 TRINITY_DN2595_c0_g2_i1:190-1860(+)
MTVVVMVFMLLFAVASLQAGSTRKLSQSVDCKYDFVDQQVCGYVPWIDGNFQIISPTDDFANSSDYPFLVSLQLEKEDAKGCYQHFCAGTVIAPNLVLSAAHCFQDLVSPSLWPVKPIWVSFYPQCRHQGNSEYKRIAVNEVYIHPLYKFNTKYADIAILSLQGYYPGGTIQLDLNGIVEARMNVEVVGYGYVRPSDKGRYKVYPLRGGTFIVGSSESCEEQLEIAGIRDGLFNNTGMMCAFNPGTDTCDGDSGGPVMFIAEDGMKTQVAIVSWGTEVQCSSIGIGTPTVFTRISTFKDWIQKIIQEHELGFTQNYQILSADLLPSSGLSQEDALKAFEASINYTGSICTNWTDGTCYEIDLDYKSLTGSLAPELSVLTDLRDFRVDKNKLGGSLPPQYSNWVNIVRVDFDENSFTGTLPTTYSTWTNIVRAYFYKNQLTGTLPPNYSTWTKLVRGFFYENSFTGSLPLQYSRWLNLERISFRSNDLTRTLPSTYSTWTNLLWFYFSSNSLTGSIPLEYSFMNEVYAAPQEGNQLCVSEDILSKVSKGDLQDLPPC